MSSACSSTSETLLIIRQGGDHLSMARGGIYTADLAAKGSRIKWGRKEKRRKGKERKGKESNQQLCAICRHKHCHVFRWSLSVCVSVFYWSKYKGTKSRCNNFILSTSTFLFFVSVCVEAVMVSCGPVCTRLRGSRDLPVIGWRGAV